MCWLLLLYNYPFNSKNTALKYILAVISFVLYLLGVIVFPGWAVIRCYRFRYENSAFYMWNLVSFFNVLFLVLITLKI